MEKSSELEFEKLVKESIILYRGEYHGK